MPEKDAGIKVEKYKVAAFKSDVFLNKVKVAALKDSLMPVIIESKDPEALAEKLKEQGAKVLHVYEIIKAVAVEMPARDILTASNDKDVKFLHEDKVVTTCLDVSVPLIGATKIWESKIKGEDIVAAVVDTGVDPNHPNLKGKVIASEDFTEEGYFDGNGHGTHVADTIAGNGTASGNKYIGVAPEAKVIAAKVLASNGSGTFSGVIAGIEWAAKQNPHVMNLSLGANVYGSCDGTDAASLAVDAAMDLGVVVCVAAGNAGPGASTVGTPGCAKKVITVGATDDNDNMAWFSSRGPTKDARVKPDVTLPGVNIIAARAKDTTMGTPIDQYHTQASGTSMATPHCCGVACLLKSKWPDLTPQQVKDLLMKTAIDLKIDPNSQGKGRVDVVKAFEKYTPPKKKGAAKKKKGKK